VAGKVLIVEDEPVLGMMLQDLLERAGHAVVHVESVAAAEAALAGEARFDLVLSDYLLPDQTGLELATHLGERHPGLRMILVTACLEPEIDERVRSDPAIVDVVRKPMDVFALSARVDQALAGPGTSEAAAC